MVSIIFTCLGVKTWHAKEWIKDKYSTRQTYFLMYYNYNQTCISTSPIHALATYLSYYFQPEVNT